MKIRYLVLIGLIVSLSTSCRKEINDPVEQNADYSSGIYVLNEGSFLSGNASITHLDWDFETKQNLYAEVNESQLGDVGVDLLVLGENIYATINNSQRVVSIDRNTFLQRSMAAGLSYPRRLLAMPNGNVAVSNGDYGGEVVFMDPFTLQIQGNVEVGLGAEGMVVSSNYLFVANNGGWVLDSTISVIDVNGLNIVGEVGVGHRPIDLDVDNQGRVWSLCSGETFYDSDWNVKGHSMPRLVVLDEGGVIDALEIGEVGDHPVSLAMSADGQSVFFVNGGLFKVSATNQIETPELLVSGQFRTVDVDPFSGELWLTSAPDYISNDSIHRYTVEGVFLDSHEVGVAPVRVVFAE